MTFDGPVLVTGATGFLGGQLAARLRGEGAEVIGTSRGRAYSSRGATVEAVDLRTQQSVDELFARCRFAEVYHLAAYGVRSDESDVTEAIGMNTLAAANLARAAIANGVSRFVYLGTAYEYAAQDRPVDESAPVKPVNLYGAAKAAASLLLDYFFRAEGLPLITLRAFAAYGPGEKPPKLIPFVCSQALDNQPVSLTSGNQVRDYLYVDDLIEGVLAAREKALPGSVYNLGAGVDNAITIRSLVELVLRAAGRPATLCQFGTMKPRRQEPLLLAADIARAKSELGWQPRIPLHEGIQRTVEWNMAERERLVVNT